MKVKFNSTHVPGESGNMGSESRGQEKELEELQGQAGEEKS